MQGEFDPIHYGMFIMPFHDPAKPLAQCYDEDLELVVRAEELGFSEFWIGEHHTMEYESIVMPEIFIGRALGETTKIRLGPAPVCLNMHHPFHVASRLAFLDHLSKGRLNLCFGPGSVAGDMEPYGVDPKNAPRMVTEAIDIILGLWGADPPYEYDGEFWKIRIKEKFDEVTKVGYIKKPYQKPHPPIAMPGMSRNSKTMQACGRLGFAPFVSGLVTSNVVADLWKNYELGCEQAGRTPQRKDFRVARSIFLADTTEEAQRKARSNSMARVHEYVGLIFDRGPGRLIYKRDPEMSDADCNLDYLMSEQIIAGDVDEVLRRLLLMFGETGPIGTLILMGYDLDDKESWFHSMELFSNELMPALNRAVATTAPAGAPAYPVVSANPKM